MIVRDLFVIVDDSNDEFWSNDIGWVDYIDNATVFTKEQTLMNNLPIGVGQVRWMNLCSYIVA